MKRLLVQVEHGWEMWDGYEVAGSWNNVWKAYNMWRIKCGEVFLTFGMGEPGVDYFIVT